MTEDAAFGIQLIGQILVGLETAFADAGAASGQGVDIADLDAVLRIRSSDKHRQRHGCSDDNFAHA
jgi:hypothetical protein